MACIADGMSTLGPVVVAQQVVFHSGCSFIGIGTAPSEISWEVTSADGSWRLSKGFTQELIGNTTMSQHMRSEPCQPHGLTTVRWRSLTFFQLHFGGHKESCKIPIEETWHVLLMGCLLWVQWWSHNKSCFTVEVEHKFLFSAPC